MARAILALVLICAAAGASARDRSHVRETWNGGLSIHEHGRSTYIAPPPDEDGDEDGESDARLHCSRTGKTTTCTYW